MAIPRIFYRNPLQSAIGVSFSYITVWMGAVHNIMSYMTVAGFFALGLSVPQVFWAVMLSAAIVSAGYVLNGYSASKYGIPFAMLLRDSFGVKGSVIPALCRGLIAGVVFFGATTVVGLIVERDICQNLSGVHVLGSRL